MTGYEYILAKQTNWAQNQRKELFGSAKDRGRPAYTSPLEENLFQGLLPETRADFEAGDGGELAGRPQRMAAIHSSSALGVNIFQYWTKAGDVAAIAAACGLCAVGNKSPRTIRFERKFEICPTFQRCPNLDVVIYNDDQSRIKAYGIESKFSEAYSARQHPGLASKYLDLADLWEGIPATRTLAKMISPMDTTFRHLHAAQLIKHVLGLKQRYSAHGFRLLYLWYDVLGEEGTVHRKEIEKFTELIASDGISFTSMSHQELIVRLSKQTRDKHTEYVDYISARYL